MLHRVKSTRMTRIVTIATTLQNRSEREFGTDSSLEGTVWVSRDFAVPHSEAGLFQRMCGAGQAARSAETGVTR